MKVKTWLRNITTDIDFIVYMPANNLNDILDKNCEYVILDCDVLAPGEFDSIHELNDFLEGCIQNGITKETLEVLSKAFLYNEVVEMIREESFTIIDFSSETSDWLCGLGGDITNDFDKGMCLFDSGYYNPFNFKMNDAIHCWIDWAAVWRNANCDGWREVSFNGHGYLVHR